MMKSDAIKKINIVGRVGGILALITKIFVILILVLCLFGFIVSMILPSDLCRIKIDGKTEILLDLAFFGWEADEETSESIRQEVEDSADINYEGNDFSVDRVDMEGSQIKIDASARVGEFSIKPLAWTLLGAMINLVFLLISVIFAGRLAKAFRYCESPFESNVISRMKQFAYSLIPWTVISCVIDSLLTSIWTSSAKFSFRLDVEAIFMVLIILGLAFIFQYGAVLQQESDETL